MRKLGWILIILYRNKLIKACDGESITFDNKLISIFTYQFYTHVNPMLIIVLQNEI